jgi:hypothetical protein
MDFDWQKFVNPAQFSNANYITDLNPAGGMAGVRDSIPASVMGAVVPGAQNAETPSMGQVVQGAVAPHMKRYQQISNVASKAGISLPSLPSLTPEAPTYTGEQHDPNW